MMDINMDSLVTYNPQQDFKLILAGSEAGGGWLILPLPDGSTRCVELEGRHVKVLLVLNDALKEDEQKPDLEEVGRGWRSDENIAEAYGEGEKEYRPEPESIANYRSQIRDRIRRATPPEFDEPELFIRKTGTGKRRLVKKLVVVN